ncbi:MAG: PAS domain-containing protein, partial [Leptolyngbyaceae cyanobacterium SL_7_1]|nr:PAS domain-containing protein [Leptolyngbyaceae cyanobacterium SL_7_1]
MHPDDRHGLTQVVDRAIVAHSQYRHDYRVVWSDGSIHWIEGRGRAFYDEAGQPVRMIGTVTDIDDRKQNAAQRDQLVSSSSNCPSS